MKLGEGGTAVKKARSPLILSEGDAPKSDVVSQLKLKGIGDGKEGYTEGDGV